MGRAVAPRYGSFPTTADVGIWARGKNAAELFEAAGTGLFALMTDLRRVRPREERSISASGPDAPSLLVAYLNELILLQQTEGFLGRRIHARPLGDPPTSLLATVSGEVFDPARHTRRKEVKAATFHEVSFDVRARRVRVIVDI